MDSRDGIITKLEIPCERSNQQLPIAFRGMTYHDLEQELMRKAESIRVGFVVPVNQNILWVKFNYFLSHQLKHLSWVLKRTVSLRKFF